MVVATGSKTKSAWIRLIKSKAASAIGRPGAKDGAAYSARPASGGIMVDAKAKMFAPFAAMSPAVFRVSQTVSQAGVAARLNEAGFYN